MENSVINIDATSNSILKLMLKNKKFTKMFGEAYKILKIIPKEDLRQMLRSYKPVNKNNSIST